MNNWVKTQRLQKSAANQDKFQKLKKEIAILIFRVIEMRWRVLGKSLGRIQKIFPSLWRENSLDRSNRKVSWTKTMFQISRVQRLRLEISHFLGIPTLSKLLLRSSKWTNADHQVTSIKFFVAPTKSSPALKHLLSWVWKEKSSDKSACRPKKLNTASISLILTSTKSLPSPLISIMPYQT